MAEVLVSPCLMLLDFINDCTCRLSNVRLMAVLAIKSGRQFLRDIPLELGHSGFTKSFLRVVFGLKLTLQRAVKNGHTNTSAVAEHAWQQQHRMDWSASEVMDYSQQRHSRVMLQSWQTYTPPVQSDSMNREHGPLPTLYRSLWAKS